MYIKEVSIKGFRTYRDPCVFQFSPGYNVIGLNGSGKSNVLLAVAFALAENLEHANRTCYLYRGDENSLDENFSAHVEVVFDISRDVNIQSFFDSKGDLRLKRIFSRSKDLYLVNGRQMSRKDYRQFIESVNLIHFSKQSASYRNDLHFIVKQGAVGKICNMTAEERLAAFRDIIGHRSFDCKIEESTKILQDFQVMSNSIESQLAQITRKIDALDFQRGEGQEWASLDEERRIIQAKLTMIKLSQLQDSAYQHECEESKQTETISLLNGRIDMLEMDLRELRGSLAIVETMDDLSTKRAALEAANTSLNDVTAESHDLHKEVELLSHNKGELERELNTLSSSIDSTSQQFKDVEHECNTVSQNIQDLETQLSEVMHKQRSPGEKTQEMISRLEKQKERAYAAIKEEEAHKATLETSLRRCMNDQQLVRDEISKYTDLCATKSSAFQEITHQLEECMELKRSKQNELSASLIKQSSLRLKYGDAEKNFNKVALSQKQTINMITQWLSDPVSEKHRANYIGILIGIISVADAFKVAVEQTLGAKLFTVVFRTMASAKALIGYIESSGVRYNNIRIVAMEVLPKTRNNAPVDGLDRNVAMPLVECITFPNQIKPLVDSLVNDYCLVENAEVASQMTCNRFNCVTPDGQVFYHKGSVSGGYVNVQESVLKLYGTMKHIENELEALNATIENINIDLKTIDEKQEELSNQRNVVKSKRSTSLEKLNQLQMSLQHLTSLEESIRQKLKDVKKEKLMYQIKAWDDQIALFRKSQPSSQAEIAELTRQQESLQEDLLLLRRKKNSLEANIQELSDNLAILMEKRNAAAKRMITTLQMLEDYSRYLGELEGKATALKQAHDTLRADFLETSEKSERLQQQRDELSGRLHKLESQLSSYRSEMGEATARMHMASQTISGIRLAIKETEDELSRLERDVKTQAQRYPVDSKEQLMSKLADLNKKCSRYDLSSRSCTHDCDTLKTEFSELKERYDRVMRSNGAILKSMKALKSQKDANLLQMLNQLNDKLSQTFEELVPNGRIRAVLLRREVTSRDPAASVAIRLPECYVDSPDDDTFTGLDLKVSFNNTSDTLQQLYQLSGGQKTLVSLAFILASQRLQAAPFYLLDEIDAALDDGYRVNVSKLLQKQCQGGSQCILTTFRPELLGPGEMFYEIRNEGGVSVMRNIGVDEALSVITRCTLPLPSGVSSS